MQIPQARMFLILILLSRHSKLQAVSSLNPLKPAKESVVSMLQLKLENGEPDNKNLMKKECVQG